MGDECQIELKCDCTILMSIVISLYVYYCMRFRVFAVTVDVYTFV